MKRRWILSSQVCLGSFKLLLTSNLFLQRLLQINGRMYTTQTCSAMNKVDQLDRKFNDLDHNNNNSKRKKKNNSNHLEEDAKLFWLKVQAILILALAISWVTSLMNMDIKDDHRCSSNNNHKCSNKKWMTTLMKYSIVFLDHCNWHRCLTIIMSDKCQVILIISTHMNLVWTTIRILEVVECQDLNQHSMVKETTQTILVSSNHLDVNDHKRDNRDNIWILMTLLQC